MCRGLPVATLNQSHRAQVVFMSPNSQDFCTLRVRSKHLLEDTLHKFRCGLITDKRLRVTFLGEPAVDEGKP